METADLIVIGSGQGGVPLAADFAKAGKNVVLFERARWAAVASTMAVRLLKPF